ncbi:transcriptional regulator, AraC family [Octadecabacter temperatus]|uniref:Arabinose operon regulatory protein n=1 Tax=Octadecabacter temperatus TaxID=1458307 RepID=A0A0K0Y4K9_9RHOB|nr:AraC family transcriptional regulator [Octadecabacter temperatus]AKS45933.1 Arabinose operon regulatory protein [Octadecabacter temperatus]SIO03824.1 transcriptional regulator, AraC family [Octadecabacter temperatus]
MMTDPQNRLALTAIAQNAGQGRWRTEAMRSHASPRLIFVARGQGRITIAGLTSGFGANNLIYIPAGTMYGFEVGPTVFGQMLTVPSAMADEWPLEPVHLRLRDVIAQKELAALLDVLERELKSDQAASTRAAHYHLGLLAIYFERQLEVRTEDSKDARKDSAAARLVAAYTDLIERDFHQHEGVADYAAKLGVTPTHLARSCKQTSGKSALTLLNDRILFEARLLLRDTKAPVRQIADDLGFGSAAYFTRAFQTQTGLTPSEFRKKGPLAQA